MSHGSESIASFGKLKGMLSGVIATVILLCFWNVSRAYCSVEVTCFL